MKRSKFSLSHYRLTTLDMGRLIPLTWFEALPGDSVQHATSCLIRATPLLAPVMHPVRVRIHHFYVPNRLMWEDWEDFITGGDDGAQKPETPYLSLSEVIEGSLHDQMGVPVGDYTSNPLEVSALPYRAYNMIYNEHYRDQDLIDELEIGKESGEDLETTTDIKHVSWEKDYFTTARPWEQKGNQVTIPIGESANVVGDGAPTFREAGGGGSLLGLNHNAGDANVNWGQNGSASGRAEWNDPNLLADLSTATGITVNDLRLALSIQRYQEARAKFGSRYVEYLRHLGIRASDQRLMNPEYLGGGRQTIQFSEIIQTAPDPLEQGTEVGTLRGHGIAAMRTNRYRRFFEEHGVVMTFMSVIPKTVYTSSLHKKWSRQIKEDYFQKELQFIGEQEVHNREIQANHTEPGGVFGYQQRYDEYRTIPSSVAGEFNSIQDHWHYARQFSGDVALNQSFVESVPTKRPNASQETDVLYIMANHSIQARRQLAKYPKPRTF
ncbi:MAG: Capsid protein (F protein) [Candidatus Argoarchaeum ethanivorans]|uniref:Capsid protein (F protein) n=1 Tax=Candidatus Argoarchaeum ethanivorans TaxID=2608793 RepID=A0A812A031_9EURY|nr:MAG: Capsid protein (F protein) [Candidatus Argoarchaeum ethanivorans]